jgi:pyridoxal 5'-phosphate synthase pdxT subunit
MASEKAPSALQITIGVLAIQGAVEEHVKALKNAAKVMSTEFPILTVNVREIKLPEHFLGLDGIILPGGESTAMAIIGERWGLFGLLKNWVAEKRPIWGTCAGE